MRINKKYSSPEYSFVSTTAMTVNGSYARYYRECAELEKYWVNQGIADYYGMNSLTLVEE